jgi:hypothetical protein
MVNMKALWRQLAAWVRMPTRYTRALEEEVARLRAENRALVNSILGVAGIPPMRAAARAATQRGLVGSGFSPDLAREARGFRNEQGGPEGRPYENLNAPRPGATSLRRRSWQQIGRALEIADARAAQRERESDTETFPPPRRVVSRL